MKKSIVAMLSITALATVANAETLHTGTDFEGISSTNVFWATHNDSGTQAGETFYWYATEDQPFGVYTTYETAVDGNTKYLALETDGNRVYRTIDSRGNFTTEPSGRAVSGTIYFDSLVQFTVNEDDAPATQDGDKLVVWLKGDEANQTTNLVIKAGYLDDGRVDASNYVVQTSSPVLPGNWYRLTIEAIPLINGASADYGYLGFRVRIDGDYVTTTDSKGSVQADINTWADDVGGTAVDVTAGLAGLFPSLVAGGQGTPDCDTLACVGFEGTGAIDSLLFTDEDPIAPVISDVPGFVVNGQTNTYENVVDFIAAFKAGQTLALPEGWSFNTETGAIGPDGGEPYATVPTYYNVDATTGAISLNETVVKPVIGTTEGAGTESDTEPITVGETTVTLNVTNAKAGLYYGVRKYTAIGGTYTDTWQQTAQATDGNVTLTVDKTENATAEFYQIIVNDVIPATPAPAPGE